jgi:6-phosphogluconolactonase
MQAEILADAGAVARRAAQCIAAEARAAAALRGRFTLAVSGGSTPWPFLRALAALDAPWEAVHIFQVDERVAADGDPHRNLTHLRASLDGAPLPSSNLHAMPVNDADLTAAAARYAGELAGVCGRPPTLDVVHLGLGVDGHTASLVPGDAALGVADRDVALTGPYDGHRRMTLTYPAIDRARRVLWVVTGAEKAPALARLRRGDRTIPAGRVCAERALLLADRAAAGA